MVGEMQFAQMTDAREIAYRAMSDGDGPLILHTASGPFPVDLLDEDPMYDRFLRTLGRCGRLVVWDKPGIGSSDPVDRDRNFHDQMTDAYLAVLDAIDADAAWIVGSTPSAITSTIRAHPTRVLGAVLINPMSPDQFRRVAESARERERKQMGGEIHPSRADDPAFVEWSQRASRLGASATEWAALLSVSREAWQRFATDPIPDAPPVMLIRRRDAMSSVALERWNGIFPDAECVTIEGADAGVMALDAGLIAELAASFITGAPIETRPHRELVAVLFTDLVESTPAAAASGDAVWRATLDRYDATLLRTIQRHHGTVVKHTGDGALATLASGSDAVAAAIDLHNSTRDLGLDARTGIHVGEVEHRDDDIGGIAVHLAARVMGHGRPGEILVTSTVVDSSTGGAHRFNERGPQTLKGLDRPWPLFAVDSNRS